MGGCEPRGPGPWEGGRGRGAPGVRGARPGPRSEGNVSPSLWGPPQRSRCVRLCVCSCVHACVESPSAGHA